MGPRPVVFGELLHETPAKMRLSMASVARKHEQPQVGLLDLSSHERQRTGLDLRCLALERVFFVELVVAAAERQESARCSTCALTMYSAGVT